MTEKYLTQLKSQIDKIELETFYKAHSAKETAKQFHISETSLRELLKEYNIVKTKEDIQKTKENTCLNKFGVKNVFQLEDNKKRGEENPSCNPVVVAKIRETKHRNNSYAQSHKKAQQTIIERYGSMEAYNAHIKQEQEKTLIEKYGTLENAYAHQQEHRVQTFLKKYGVDNPYKAQEIKDKIRDTTKARYGVDYPTQNPNVMDKINNRRIEHYGKDNLNNWRKGHQTRIANCGSLEQSYLEAGKKQRATCLERYGYECLLSSPYYSTHFKKKNSQPNIEFAELLKKNNIDYTQEFVIGTKSYDFKVGNILIEINPTITHNLSFSPYGNVKSPNYHKDKTLLAKENGYRCIHVWDWDDKEKVVKLLLNRDSIYARKCELQEIAKDEAVNFINTYHIQGYAKDSIRIGLCYNNEIVSIMTFGKPRYNKNYEYEIIRYCSSYNVIGGAEKLFSYFVKKYNPKSVISYCDYSKFSGDVYDRLGFTYTTTRLSKHWYNIKTNRHILDSLLRSRGFDQLLGEEYECYGKGTDNATLMKEHGFFDVMDAGQGIYTKIF